MNNKALFDRFGGGSSFSSLSFYQTQFSQHASQNRFGKAPPAQLFQLHDRSLTWKRNQIVQQNWMPFPSLTHTLESKAYLKTILKNIFEKLVQLPCFGHFTFLLCTYLLVAHNRAHATCSKAQRSAGMLLGPPVLLAKRGRGKEESPCSAGAWPRRPAATWALLTWAQGNEIFMPWLQLHCDKPFSNTYIPVNYSTHPTSDFQRAR